MSLGTQNENEDQLHIVMVPWLAFGHLIPFLELSKSLAKMGHRVSFISTPRNIQRLVQNQSPSPFINFVSIPLAEDENLRDQAEATVDLPPEEVPYLKRAYDSLEGPVSIFLETARPDWIIYDFVSHWLPPIASRLDIPGCFFSTFNASVKCFFGPPSGLMESDIDDSISRNRKTLEDFTVSPNWISFPTNLAFRIHEIRRVFSNIEIKVPGGISDAHRFRSTILGCQVMAIRSCMEFESEHLDLLEKLFEKPIIFVGLLPPPSPGVGEGDDKHEEWMRIREWLDKQEQRSMVYITLGTEAALTKEETSEKWFSRSKGQWIADGERNSKFFHKNASYNQRVNSINSLLIDGVMIHDKDVINEEAKRYYTYVFTENVRVRPTFNNLVLPSISVQQSISIEKPFEEEEVKDVI
ncbi:putative UDP-rhamnose:rhamnosyltransferase 1 [Papaver somniferum]|uniref:putative UDP-rhamnose:rhamnosyltransferase 1 n=1 Tax=Papaver somniferum TaxID=3469 RepID=UPI000E6F82C5|nr:putative UDP-rhamnose:rhamnosyltransferase 1 [Papaver somniferum]